MKHIKLFENFEESKTIYESFKSDVEIHEICKKYNIKKYTIKNGVVDVNGDVIMHMANLTKLPLKFGKVTGLFTCSDNKLTSLEGCPDTVGGSFNCSDNKLTSLEGCPDTVGGWFNCSDNKLTSLEGCASSIGKDVEVTLAGDFNCSRNKLISLEGFPISIGRDVHLSHNPIYNLWILFKDLDKLEFFIDCDPMREPDEDGLPIILLDRLNFFLEEIGKEPVTNVIGCKCI